MRLIYSLIVYLLTPVLLGYFFWRSFREPEYRRRWSERLGFIGRRQPGCIWLHAASVGETQAALPLIEKLLDRYPERRLVVSSFTPTGSALVRDRLGDRVDNLYLPIDTPAAVRRFLSKLQPCIGVIIETELWPNLLVSSRSRAIPMVLASATLSEQSARGYRRFPGRPLMARALQAFHVLAVQTAEDAGRFAMLGVREGRIEISGNLKFDLTVDKALPGHAATMRHEWQALGRPVWIAASTHEGEEQIALECYKALLTDFPDQLLLLVPRHPQRFEAVAGLLDQSGLAYARRSRSETIDSNTQVVLVDTLGELMLFYALADVAFVGGSLVPIGGHNLLEPASLGKPIITGPFCESQQQLCDLLNSQAALCRLEHAQGLEPVLRELLPNTEKCRAMGAAGQEVVKANRGALARVEGVIGRCVLASMNSYE